MKKVSFPFQVGQYVVDLENFSDDVLDIVNSAHELQEKLLNLLPNRQQVIENFFVPLVNEILCSKLK